MNSPRPLRIMALASGWTGTGGHSFNRDLSTALADVGCEVIVRVSEPVTAQAHPRLTVQGLDPVPGLDSRGQLLRVDGLPRNIDVIIGHGRFSGATGYLRDQFYPQAHVVHVVHALTDELDRWRGDPHQASHHAETERRPVNAADLVVGVGPLLADDAQRMAQMGDRHPPVHEMIPGIAAGDPPQWRAKQLRICLLLVGRVDDPIKGALTAARATGCWPTSTNCS